MFRIYQEQGQEWYSINFQQDRFINWSEQAYIQYQEEIAWKNEKEWFNNQLLFKKENMERQGHLPLRYPINMMAGGSYWSDIFTSHWCQM